MAPTFRPCLALFLAGLLIAGAACRAESLDEQLLADAQDGRLDRFDFLSACLIAGGVADPCELAHLRSRFDELRQRIDPSSIHRLPRTESARALHARLHEEILVGDYQKEATDLRLAIGRGDYNCLSAVAIYWSLASEAGIGLKIWSRPGHVSLLTNSSRERIEPGSREWINELNGNGTRRLTPPARQITPTQLLGKFYYNRGVQCLEQGDYAQGLSLLRVSLALDPDDREARENLLAGLNNWAVELCRRERFAEAQALIEQGLAIDSGFAPLVANARYLHDKVAP